MTASCKSLQVIYNTTWNSHPGATCIHISQLWTLVQTSARHQLILWYHYNGGIGRLFTPQACALRPSTTSDISLIHFMTAAVTVECVVFSVVVWLKTTHSAVTAAVMKWINEMSDIVLGLVVHACYKTYLYSLRMLQTTGGSSFWC